MKLNTQNFKSTTDIIIAPNSNKYLEWVKQANLPPLTNTQSRFAEWLLTDEISDIISQIGDLDTIFNSVRKFVKK